MRIQTSGGLVNVGETLTFFIEGDKPGPDSLTIYERYLEKNGTQRCSLPLRWDKTSDGYKAQASYMPSAPGNYYAGIGKGADERTAYFGVWAPGIAVQTMWVVFASAWHACGNLHDFYGSEFQRYHLPADIEIGTTGGEFLSRTWYAIDNMKNYHRSTSCKVYPFLDFALAEFFVPELKGRRGGEMFGPLPNPTAHGLSVGECWKFLQALQNHWQRWNLPPFEMVGHYTPSNTLVEACSLEGLLGIDGVFSEHDFNDGGSRWEYGWRQYHFGMSNFPYYVRREDFRKAGRRDEWPSPVLIFPADLRHPVLSHAGYTGHSNDMASFIGYWRQTDPLTGGPSIDVSRTLDKYIEFQEEMYASIAANRAEAPVVLCGPVEMGDNECPGIVAGNRMILQYFGNRGRSGQVIFSHKADVAKYYQRHLAATPDQSYVVHDLLADLPAPRAVLHVMKGNPVFDQFGPQMGKPEIFPETLVWCGENGKAAFLKRPIIDEPAQNADIAPCARVTIQPQHNGAPWLPFWWYDYRVVQNTPETRQMEMVDLSGFAANLVDTPRGEVVSFVVDAPRKLSQLPVCLWGYSIPEAGRIILDGIAGCPATLLFLDVHPGLNRFEWPVKRPSS